jgi:hypothetical protein
LHCCQRKVRTYILAYLPKGFAKLKAHNPVFCSFIVIDTIIFAFVPGVKLGCLLQGFPELKVFRMQFLTTWAFLYLINVFFLCYLLLFLLVGD